MFDSYLHSQTNPPTPSGGRAFVRQQVHAGRAPSGARSEAPPAHGRRPDRHATGTRPARDRHATGTRSKELDRIAACTCSLSQMHMINPNQGRTNHPFNLWFCPEGGPPLLATQESFFQ